MPTHLELRWLRSLSFGAALMMSAGACEQANTGAVPDKYMLAEESSDVDDALPAKPSSAPVTPTATTTPEAGDAAVPAIRSVVGALGIGVSDLKKSTDFYTRVLGMKQTQTFALGYMDEVVVAWEGVRGSSIVLMHWTDSSKINYKDLPIKIVVYVADPKALADKIRAEGLEITREPTPVPTLGNAVVGLAKDPDGYVIEILQATGQG